MVLEFRPRVDIPVQVVVLFYSSLIAIANFIALAVDAPAGDFQAASTALRAGLRRLERLELPRRVEQLVLLFLLPLPHLLVEFLFFRIGFGGRGV